MRFFFSSEIELPPVSTSLKDQQKNNQLAIVYAREKLGLVSVLFALKWVGARSEHALCMFLYSCAITAR